jgi:PAS domain-containing protein
MRAGMIATVVGVGVVLGVAAGGCSSAGIALKERLGYAKREQLVTKIEAARDSQEAAKAQFESALAEFIAVTGVEAGELEARYNALRREYGRAQDRAGAVRSRIKETDRVADALFREWESELGEYSDASLRRSSEQQLRQTKDRYAELMGAMRAAADRMDPVLARFNDQVLFLKHNLNARAVAGLRQNVSGMQDEVAVLIREMEASIAEANRFIRELGEAR